MNQLADYTIEAIREMKTKGQSWSAVEDYITRQVGYDREVIKLARDVYNRTERSHLATLKEAHPSFPWPTKGEKGDYPEELGATIGDTRHFGFPPKQYTLSFRTSSEASAITRVERYNTEGKQALITYNPTRLETYGVWIR